MARGRGLLMSALFAAVVAVAALTPRAQAFPPELTLYERWLLGSHMPLVEVAIVDEPCPAYINSFHISCYDHATRTVYLWSGQRRRRTLLHELGHAFDFEYFSNDDRIVLQSLMAVRSDVSWRWHGDPNGPRWPYPPEERFADRYRDCAMHGRTPFCELAIALAADPG